MGVGGGEEKGRRFSPSALSFFRFHLSPFPQKRLILRQVQCEQPPVCSLGTSLVGVWTDRKSVMIVTETGNDQQMYPVNPEFILVSSSLL